MAVELRPEYDIPAIITNIGINLQGDFCFSRSFDRRFILSLMYEGFLIMCDKQRGGYLLLPKLHVSRCLLEFVDLKVPKRIRSLALPFTFSVNKDFEGVIKGCHRQHGQSWLYPPLVDVLREIHKLVVSHVYQQHKARLSILDFSFFRFMIAFQPYSLSYFRLGASSKIQVHSVEVWEGDELVAGEVGVSVGTCFVSYSGFTKTESSGTVQCITLGKYLQTLGFKLWDLGMGMAYKLHFGAKNFPRLTFMAKLRKIRDEPTPLITTTPFPCAALFPGANATSAVTVGDLHAISVSGKALPQRNPDSKRQRKYRAKKARIAQYKAERQSQKLASGQIAHPVSVATEFVGTEALLSEAEMALIPVATEGSASAGN